jgi:peptidyl-prolyl cis-trans isomerase C
MKFYAILSLGLLAAVSACNKTSTTPVVAAPVKPVATVNGTAIARATYDYYVKQASGKASSDLTVAERDKLLDALISAEVAAQQALKDGLDKKGDLPATTDLSRWQGLQAALAESYLKDRKATEAELKGEYDTQVAAMEKAQYKAHHILVKTEAEAQAVLARLAKKEKFETVAKDLSVDTESAKNGGSLGDFFSPATMVPEFSAALAGMKKGEVSSKPVQSQFGYHLIRLDDVRQNVAPPFDGVKTQLEQLVLSKKFKSYIDELQKTAKIEKTL